MKRTIHLTILILLLIAFMTACATPTSDPEWTPTPEDNGALEFLVEVQKAEATAKAIEATQMWIYGQLTATAQVKEDRATQQSIIATQQAQNMQATATHEAFIVQQAGTDRAWNTTVTAAVAATATAYPLTSTAQSVYQTQTQQAWQTTATMDAAYGAAQATAAYGNAQSVELAVQRERSTNMTRAWLPWMGFVAAMSLIVVMGIRWSRTRVVQKDAFGAAPVLIMDGKVIDMDRMPGPAMITTKKTIELVAGNDEVTKRAQMAQMIRSLPSGKPDQDMLPLLNSSIARSAPQIEVLGDGSMNRVILDEIEDQIIEED